MNDSKQKRKKKKNEKKLKQEIIFLFIKKLDRLRKSDKSSNLSI